MSSAPSYQHNTLDRDGYPVFDFDVPHNDPLFGQGYNITQQRPVRRSMDLEGEALDHLIDMDPMDAVFYNIDRSRSGHQHQRASDVNTPQLPFPEASFHRLQPEPHYQQHQPRHPLLPPIRPTHTYSYPQPIPSSGPRPDPCQDFFAPSVASTRTHVPVALHPCPVQPAPAVPTRPLDLLAAASMRPLVADLPLRGRPNPPLKTMAAGRTSAGRVKGAVQYCNSDCELLLSLYEKHKPVGQDQWERLYVEYIKTAQDHRGGWKALKDKFKSVSTYFSHIRISLTMHPVDQQASTNRLRRALCLGQASQDGFLGGLTRGRNSIGQRQ
jgi:hypothetical protein